MFPFVTFTFDPFPYPSIFFFAFSHFSKYKLSNINPFALDRDIFMELSAKWQVSRDTVKKLCYGIIYGMGGKTLSEHLKKTIEEGNKLMQSFFQSFPS